MGLKWKDLILDVDSVDWYNAMENWFWLIDDGLSPFILSTFGDAFFLNDDEEVFWLDTGEGEFLKVANSIDEFNQLIHDKDRLNKWFLPSVLEELKARGVQLSQGECYHYIIPPLAGGEYEAENFETANIIQHFHITGVVAEQAQVLPAGSPIDIYLEN